MKIFFISLISFLLLCSCAKQSDYELLQKRYSDLDAQISILVQKTDINTKLLSDSDKKIISATDKISKLETDLTKLDRKVIENNTLFRSKTQQAILSDLNDQLLKNMTTFPKLAWFRKHANEHNFNKVERLIFDLNSLLDTTTNNRLVLTNDDLPASVDLESKENLTILLGISTLYEQDPAAAVYLANFWSEKALINNQLFINLTIEKYSRKDLTNQEHKDATYRELREELNLVTQTYYYEHWKEIRETILDSLISAKLKREVQDENRK